MLPVTGDSVRLFLHITAAAVWIGGQFTLGAVVSTVRQGGPDLVRSVARRFQLLAWPAFAVLVATGIWNVLAVHLGDQSSEYLTTLAVKLVFVALSGLAAALHTLVAAPAVARASDERRARRARAWSGIFGAGSLTFALVAAFLGVLLA